MRLRYGLFLAFTVACGSSTSYSSSPPPAPPPGPPPPPAPPPPITVAVSIAEYTYTPDTVTIKAGNAVKWTNMGTYGHSATADGGSFDSGTLGPPGVDQYGNATAGATYTKTFGTQGSFPYHCTVHPTVMMGVVIVTP